jgi:hypothetical protein
MQSLISSDNLHHIEEYALAEDRGKAAEVLDSKLGSTVSSFLAGVLSPHTWRHTTWSEAIAKRNAMRLLRSDVARRAPSVSC